MASSPRVALWHTVTVASPMDDFCSSNEAIGRPTMLLRPITATCLPQVLMPLRRNSSIIPAGAAGGMQPMPKASLPMLSGVKPSTSLRGLMTSSRAL